VNPQTGDTRGDNQNWNDLRSSKSDRNSTADDVSFILQLLDEMVRTHGLDKGRIYVTGASNGGMLTYRLLIEAPERFAAGAAFIALLPADLRGLEPPPKPTPLLILNGTEDPLVRWEGGPIRGQTEKLMSAESHRDWWIRANRAQGNGVREEALPDASPGADRGRSGAVSESPGRRSRAPVTDAHAARQRHGPATDWPRVP
jgi:polyhydroxybutyrate depolymerase